MPGLLRETLVKLAGQNPLHLSAGGTRRRGGTEEEDRRLEQELLADEKELSEHNMLVDLGRNDIGRISEIGSVQVEKYCEIERLLPCDAYRVHCFGDAAEGPGGDCRCGLNIAGRDAFRCPKAESL